MAHPKGWKPDRDFLYQAYIVENRRVTDIIRELACRKSTVIQALREYGFTRRQAHGRITKEWLEEHYVTRQECVEDIAVQLGVGYNRAYICLREFGIPVRLKSRGRKQVPELNDYDWLYQRYAVEYQSMQEIADGLSCCASSVARAIVRLKVPLHGAMAKAHRPKGQGSQVVFRLSQRKAIYSRDKFRCQMPDCPTRGRLHAHHIIPRSLGGLNDMTNGITLCEPCHEAILYKETEYISLFESIIASRTQEPLT